MQCIFYGRLAADPGTIRVFLVTGSDTLDHDHILRCTNLPLLHSFGQFKLGHHPLILSVEVFFGMIFVGARCQDDHPVFDFAAIHPGADQQLGSEITLETGKADNQ